MIRPTFTPIELSAIVDGCTGIVHVCDSCGTQTLDPMECEHASYCDPEAQQRSVRNRELKELSAPKTSKAWVRPVRRAPDLIVHPALASTEERSSSVVRVETVKQGIERYLTVKDK